MRIARSVLAVLFGFVLFFAAVRGMAVFAGNTDPTAQILSYLLLSLAWTVGAAMLAGYLTARIGGSHEFPHAAALGLLMVIVSYLSMKQEGITQPGWYQTTVAGCGPISAMIGAAIRMLTKGKRTPVHG